MLRSLNEWRKARVRAVRWGPKPHQPYHITFTPHFGFSIPWFGGRRLRAAPHHGLQIVALRGGRWTVVRQLAGRSKVKGGQAAPREAR